MAWLRKVLVRIETRSVNLLVLLTFVAILSAAVIVFSAIALASGRFGGPGEVVWWVIKAVLGPDYLDDQHGSFLAGVSFLVVLIGFVAFGSGTIAIVSQLVSQKVESVKKGLTKVPFEGHTVILNFNDEIFETLKEITSARKREEVAVLSDQDKQQLEESIQRNLGNGGTGQSLIVCRQGHPQYPGDLEKVNAGKAARIVVLSPQLDEESLSFKGDMMTLKLLMTLNRSSTVPETIPVIVEMGDPRSAEHMARLVQRKNVVLVDGNGIIGQILCQASLQPHLVPVFDELVSYRGNEFYFRKPAIDKGRYTREEFFARYLQKHADDIPVGLKSGGSVQVNPDVWDLAGDTEVIVVAQEQDPLGPELVQDAASSVSSDFGAEKLLGRKVLIVGSNSKLPYILEGYRAFSRSGHLAEDGAGIEVTIACEDEIDVRPFTKDHIRVRVERADVLGRTDGLKELVGRGGFDAVIVLSKEGVSPEERDVNVLTAVLLMSEQVSSRGERPQVIVELLDPRNIEIVSEYGISDVVVTTQLVSHLIAQCIRSHELKGLFDSLLNYGQNNIYVKPSTRFFPAGLSLTFGEIVKALAAGGEVALGVVEGGKVNLNPGFGHPCVVSKDTDVVVISSVF